MTLIDALIAIVILPAAAAVLFSSLDDLLLLLVCVFHWICNRGHPLTAAETREKQWKAIPQKSIAIFVPCWRESGVIAKMIEHNVAAIDYNAYHFFIGAYSNDADTLAVARELESRFRHVHLAVCAHPGPTSKADCLNWVFQRMLLFEEDQDMRFEVVMTHDAEDLIHPDSLLVINFHIADHDMVQIPVLPLPTPFSHFTHGVYCDEFSEFQLKDMRARGIMGSFIPSNGVGTGYSRAGLEKLAQSESNRIFEPACLTEDYENGMRLHNLGCRQMFVPLMRGRNGFIATREYFPSTRATAIRQRTRWVTGIALQTWERHGWSGSLPQVYWFWRDRKGLIGNPLSFATNVLFGLGIATWACSRLTGRAWGLEQSHIPSELLMATLALQVIHMSVRITAVARIYGWIFALGVPLRMVCANYINASASCRAIFRYVHARWRRQPLVWVKTEHAYPTRNALFLHKRRLGEILVGTGYVQPEELDAALATQPAGLRIGEYLVRLGALTGDELYEALSLQQSVPAGRLEPVAVSARVARALPRKVIQDWKVLPFRVAEGNMFLASPEIPSDEMNSALRGFTRMALRFQLVTPANFDELTRALL